MKKTLAICIAIILGLTTATLSFAIKKADDNCADMILFNGKIYTVDKNFGEARAVAIKDGRILAVGSVGAARRFCGPETEEINLKGLTVIPGLLDSHFHFDGHGLGLIRPPGAPRPQSAQEWLDLIAQKVAESVPGEWIFLPRPYGFESELTRWVIDTVSPDNPVLMSTTSHTGIANSMALDIVGIHKGVVVDGGHYVVDENGELTGFLFAMANMLCKRFRPPSPPTPVEKYKEGIRAAMEDVNRWGLTGVIQHGGNYNSFRAYSELGDKGEMTVRVSAYLNVRSYPWTTIEEIEEDIKALRFVTPKGLGNEWFKIGGIKTVYDGPTSMYDFYDDRYSTPERLQEIAEIVAKYGMRFAVHTCGDQAIDVYLDACEYANSKYPIDKSRWFSVHHYFPTPDDYSRILDLGIVATVQPMFIHSMYSGYYVKNDPNPPDLESICHPFRSELEAGIPLGFGSDCGVNTYDPFLGMWIAITRKSPHPGEEGWVINENESISRRQALECYTINNAYLSFEEDIKGSVEPGKLADLVVISDDIMTCPVDEIRNINVEMTVVGGKIVYQHEPGTPYPDRPYWRH